MHGNWPGFRDPRCACHCLRKAGAREVLERLTTIGGGGYTPLDPLPPPTQISQWEKMKFAKGRIDLAPGFPTPSPLAPPASSLPAADSRGDQCLSPHLQIKVERA